jgi:hypothetical protein
MSQRQSALQHNVEVNDQDELKNQSRLIADSEEDGAHHLTIVVLSILDSN